MPRVRLLAVSMVAMAACNGCAGHAPPRYTKDSLPAVVVVRVERVEVLPTRPNTTDTWDGPQPADNSDAACGLLALGAKMALPVIGEGVGLLCELASAPEQVEKDPRNPDLQLRISSAAGARYESFIQRDVLAYSFNYEFVVPVEAIPPEGIVLEILDADAQQDAESILATRLTRDRIAQILSSPAQIADVGLGAAPHVEVAVAAYVPTLIPLSRLDAKSIPTRLGPRPLQAGEVATLRAAGRYTVSSWYQEIIDPTGYPGGELRGYNFKQQPFAGAPHACGLALVGGHNRVQGVVVGHSSQFVASFAGPLRVGVNDIDPSNNGGWISFEGLTRAPSVLEWNTGAVAP